jgi:hypothetical protein
MGNRHNQFHPALKHGGYAATSVLPGENAAEFEKLYRDLIAELGPNGALENDIVATMAHLVWRKNNLATFRIAELARARCAQIRHEKVPEDKMDYSFAILGTVIEKVDPAVREAAIRAAEDQARKELGETYGLVEIGETATVDHLMKDLEVQDRLDGMIDRCLKRLLFLRGLKSISSTSSTATSSAAPPARIRGPSKAA